MREFKTVGIWGIGLIGGSIALSLKQKGVRVIGVGRTKGRLAEAKESGIIDDGDTDPAILSECDIVVVCLPVALIPQAVKTASNFLKSKPITDVGSVKKWIEDELKDVDIFVGSHPLAGSEKRGFEHARFDLLEKRKVFVIKNKKYTQQVREFWEFLDASVVLIEPEEHDRLMAYTSHLPHLVAYALCYNLKNVSSPEIGIGSGFLDSTRIALSRPALWIDIIQKNPYIEEALRNFIDSFKNMEEVIKKGWEIRSTL